jgi:glucose-6-phosphate 1-dehydrogenase
MHTKLVIFGITGDLSRRKLLPALHAIVEHHDLPELSILGVSRREVDVPELIQQATGSSLLAPITRVHTMDLAQTGEYQALKDAIDLQDNEQAVIYLSVPPGAAADIADFLGQSGLNGPNVKLLFEKPFGFDLASANDFIERTARYFRDDQVYRIDHYMAKEVAIGLLELRAQADSHHHAWSAESVEEVEINAFETLGIEDRSHFYEQTGALRDVVQGHLMQLLALVLMQPLRREQMSELPSARLQALRHLQPADPEKATRAQYDGYAQEVDNPGSTVETFVSLDLQSNDPRWQGVPIRLATGKQLHEKKTVISLIYRDGSKDTFVEGEVTSSFDGLSEAYERVLVAAMNGEKHLFTTSGEILRSWELLAPLQRSWQMGDRPLHHYKKHTHAARIHLEHYI